MYIRKLLVVIILFIIAIVLTSCDLKDPNGNHEYKPRGSYVVAYAMDFDDFQNGIFFSNYYPFGRSDEDKKRNIKFDTSLDFSFDYYFNKLFLDQHELSFDFDNYEKLDDRSISNTNLHLHFSEYGIEKSIDCSPYEKMDFTPIPIIHTVDSLYYNNNNMQAKIPKLCNVRSVTVDFFERNYYSNISYDLGANGIKIEFSLLGELKSGYANYTPFCLFPSKVKYITNNDLIFVDDDNNEYTISKMYSGFNWKEIDRSGVRDSVVVNCNIKLDDNRIYCAMFLNLFPELFGVDLTNEGVIYYEIEKNISYFVHPLVRKTNKVLSDTDYCVKEEYKIKVFVKYEDKDYLINQISFIDYDENMTIKDLRDIDWDLHTLHKLAKYENLLEEYGRTFKENMYKLSFTDEIVRKSMTQSVVF